MGQCVNFSQDVGEMIFLFAWRDLAGLAKEREKK
jgi:hypothetical protein